MTTPNRELRGIRLLGAVSTTEVRLGTLLGVEHVIAPIVMLIGDSVIFPINAETPEFVPADTLQIAPAGWNGRVLMAGDHPSEDGAMVSANIPAVLERQGFGQIFGARFDDNRLKGEVWIDPRRAAAVADGAEILRRLRAGEPVEISVGCFVVAERVEGVAPNGQAYGSIWREIIPDHVALLREGLIGACSVEMGCGTPRAAVRHYNIEPTGLRVLSDNETERLRSQVEQLATQRAAAASEADTAAAEETAVSETAVNPKLSAYLGAVGVENLAQLETLAGMSDTELRDILCEALRRVEPNFVAVTSVVPSDSTFVYLVDPDPGGPTPLKPYQRSYTLSDGKATLSDDRSPVRQRTEWVPVTAAAADQGAARHACSCGGQNTNRAEGAGGATMASNAERVTALISNPRSPFEEADRAYLEGLSEERLTACETHAAEPAGPTAEELAAQERERAQAAAAAAGTVQVPAEELATLRSMGAAYTAQRNAQKNVLVNQLKGAQSTYSEAQLRSFDNERLTEIASLLQLTAAQPANVDYVALDRAATTTEPATVPEPPKPWSMAVAKRNGAAN